MPLKGFRCKHHGEASFDTCIEANCPSAPRFVLESIKEQHGKDYHKGDVITATTMTGCLRSAYLTRVRDYYASVDSLYYSWRGTLIHKIFEFPNVEKWDSEKLYKRVVDGIEIFGKIDAYDRAKDRNILYDLKTIGDNGLNFVIKQGAKDDHVLQTNIYRWLMQLPVNEIKIVYLSMMGFAETGKENWIDQSFKYEPDIKKMGMKAAVPTGKFTKSGWQRYQCCYDTPPVPFMPDEEIENFIATNSKILKHAFDTDTVPDINIDDSTRDWKCNMKYCPVFTDCQEIEAKKGEDDGAK